MFVWAIRPRALSLFLRRNLAGIKHHDLAQTSSKIHISRSVVARLACCLLLMLTLGGTALADSNAVIQWDNAVLQAIRVNKLSPPAVARALAIVHTCMFDAWAAYDRKAVGTQLGASLRRPADERTLANKQQAISFAAFRCASDLFPSETNSFATLMASLGYDAADASTDTATATGIGNTVAAAVLEFRHHDGSNQLGDLHPGPYSDYTGYTPVNTPDAINDPDRWQPLRVPGANGTFSVQTFAAPHWGLVIPFGMTTGSQFRPANAPFSFVTDREEYIRQARQLLFYSSHLTDTTKMIAEYWADGPNSETPPGHWCLFGQFISQRDHHSLDDDVKMFFALSNAVMDAGIAAWEAKRNWDSVRPITAIHFLFAGQQVRAWRGPNQGIGLMDGANWQPYQAANVVTPPFAEYISGHSTFSAAGAEILRSFTHSDHFGFTVVLPAGSSKFEVGVPAHDLAFHYTTFTEAANEAGISRRWGGIHFPLADLTGRETGRLVGQAAWRKAMSYIDPEAAHERHGGDGDRD